MSDLRTFLAELKKSRPSDLLEIEHEVDPRYETAAIVAKLEAHHRTPVVVFKKVKGSAWPVVSNVCGSTGRLALALGCGLKDLSSRWAEACDKPIPPVLVTEAPVHEVVHQGAAVDLGILPALVYHEHDTAQPYVTGGVVAARDPNTGKINLSYHRLMIASPNTTGICIEPGKHLDRIRAAYEAQGQAMPIAVFLGHHPAWSLGTLYSGSADVEEYDVIGGLLRAPLSVVPCVSQPSLVVPAQAEVVLEGFVAPGSRIPEGPFGEFTGYGTGATTTPVFTVTALTHRADPVFQDVVSGHMEHLVLPMLALEYRAFKEAKEASPNVTQVALGAPLSVIVALKKTRDEEPAEIIRHLLEGDIYTKQVIVVDAEVDPKDFRQVLQAMALHVQADRQVFIRPNMQGTPLDPSCPSPDGKVAKLGIDATRSLSQSRNVTRNSIKKEVWDRIDVNALLRRP
ncbi:MAG: UbiD family decarboxylase [Deltaproteobacteria bacterium]|nr:UbiD family decarboxylase [Deltaproteobacteria bacterium]